MSNSADNPTIRGNRVWGNHASGIHLNGDASQGGDGVISWALVEDNIIYDNGAGGGSAINCDGVQESVFQNNLIYNQHASGISLYQLDGGGPSTSNAIVSNTILIAADGRWALDLQDGATDTAVTNNILLNGHSFRGSMNVSGDSLPGLDSDYNIVADRMTTDDAATVLTLADWQAQTGSDANSFVATASELFVDAASNDYRLSETSPAREAATMVNLPEFDLLGTPRPQGLPAEEQGSIR